MKKFIFVFKHRSPTPENVDRPRSPPPETPLFETTGPQRVVWSGRSARVRVRGLPTGGRQAESQSHTLVLCESLSSISHFNFTVTGTNLEFFN